jgi:hypothetical protein
MWVPHHRHCPRKWGAVNFSRGTEWASYRAGTGNRDLRALGGEEQGKGYPGRKGEWVRLQGSTARNVLGVAKGRPRTELKGGWCLTVAGKGGWAFLSGSPRTCLPHSRAHIQDWLLWAC